MRINRALRRNISLPLFLTEVIAISLCVPAVSLAAPGDLMRTFADPCAIDGGWFGGAVAGVGDYVSVGGSSPAGDGVVYVFDPQDGALVRTFHTPAPGSVYGNFGGAIADFQGNLLVGASQEPNGLNLFDISSGERLDAYPNTGWLGTSVAVDGSQILVGAPIDNTIPGSGGAVYLFDGRNHTALQVYASPVFAARFGNAVAFAGDHVVIGAPSYGDPFEGCGAAFVFDRATGTQLHTFLDPSPTEIGFFGTCVAAAGNDILIGRMNFSTSVYLYDGSTFALKREFQDPDGQNNGFGRSIVVSGDYVLIAAPAADITGWNSGAVYVFDINTGEKVHVYLDPTPLELGGFGASLAIFKGNVLIGECDELSTVPGEVHLFEMAAPTLEVTLVVSSTSGGSVVMPGEGVFTYPWGKPVPVQAAAEAGYHFTHWSGSAVDANKVADSAAASTTVVVDGDYTLVANFAVNLKTLTVSSGAGGSVTGPGEGSFQYPQGTWVAIEAVPEAHHYFTNWSGTAVDAGKVVNADLPVTSLIVDDDYTLVAHFKIEVYRLTVWAGEGGYIFVETRTGNTTTSWYDGPVPLLDYGTEVTVIATPYGGWKFTGWSGTMGSTESPFIFELTQDCDLEALFVPE
jgi:hypothetical protein